MRFTMRLPFFIARLLSRIMRLDTSGYMEVTATVAIAIPAASPVIPVIMVDALILSLLSDFLAYILSFRRLVNEKHLYAKEYKNVN